MANRNGPHPTPPSVSCQPLGPGCNPISMSAGGAVGVRGLNAVDSGTLSTNPLGDIEPTDQGLCAGNGSVVEDNNIGYNNGGHWFFTEIVSTSSEASGGPFAGCFAALPPVTALKA